MALPPLSSEESRRYLRHLTLPEVGPDGQKKLKASAVLVVGAGGLGSPIAMYLAAAGVGRIGLVDYDVVDETNLQRQLLHGTRDVGRNKLDSARDRLWDINPYVTVETHPVRLESHNALDIIAQYDVVADGTDNFPTRYLVNDACVIAKKPNVYGSIFQFEGQVSVFAHPNGPCYRCVHPTAPPPGLVPSCAEGGVLGALPGLIGALQAAEVPQTVVACRFASYRPIATRRCAGCLFPIANSAGRRELRGLRIQAHDYKAHRLPVILRTSSREWPCTRATRDRHRTQGAARRRSRAIRA